MQFLRVFKRATNAAKCRTMATVAIACLNTLLGPIAGAEQVPPHIQTDAEPELVLYDGSVIEARNAGNSISVKAGAEFQFGNTNGRIAASIVIRRLDVVDGSVAWACMIPPPTLVGRLPSNAMEFSERSPKKAKFISTTRNSSVNGSAACQLGPLL